MNIVTTVIKSRHSVRKFKPDTVDELAIRDAVECAARAPTAGNIQPWLFGVIRNKNMLRKIADLTDNGKFIVMSPVCFSIFGEKNEKYYLEDCCAANRKSHYCASGIWDYFMLGGRGKEDLCRSNKKPSWCTGKLHISLSGSSRMAC